MATPAPTFEAACKTHLRRDSNKPGLLCCCANRVAGIGMGIQRGLMSSQAANVSWSGLPRVGQVGASRQRNGRGFAGCGGS